MNIAVLGTGHVGGVLGRRFATGGHAVTFGSRSPASEKVSLVLKEAGENAAAAAAAEAASGAAVVVLAVPWKAAKDCLSQAGDLSGKVLVDCTNPINADFTGLDVGYTTSAAEEIAAWAPGARVVKAFNTVSAAAMADPMFEGKRASMFYCGDDAAAKENVGALAEELGFDAVDAGPLAIARYLEPLAMLYIDLAINQGWGSNCAFKILRR